MHSSVRHSTPERELCRSIGYSNSPPTTGVRTAKVPEAKVRTESGLVATRLSTQLNFDFDPTPSSSYFPFLCIDYSFYPDFHLRSLFLDFSLILASTLQSFFMISFEFFFFNYWFLGSLLRFFLSIWRRGRSWVDF